MNKIRVKNNNNFRYINRLKIIISRINTPFLFVIPFLLGLFFGAISIWYSHNYLGGHLSPMQMGLVFSCTLFLWGICGLISIIRREFPISFIIIEGMPAIILGLIWMIACWWLVIISLIKILAT